MSDELAMALADHCDGKWDAENFNETPDGTEPEVNRDYWRDLAKVAQKHVLRKLIEKAEAEAKSTGIEYQYTWRAQVAWWLKSQMEGE